MMPGMTQHSREDQEQALENALRLLKRTIRFVRKPQDRSAERAPGGRLDDLAQRPHSDRPLITTQYVPYRCQGDAHPLNPVPSKPPVPADRRGS